MTIMTPYKTDFIGNRLKLALTDIFWATQEQQYMAHVHCNFGPFLADDRGKSPVELQTINSKQYTGRCLNMFALVAYFLLV